MYQMFLTVRGAVQGSFRAALGVFMSSYDQDGELENVPLPPPLPPTPRDNFSVLIWII